MSISPIPEKLQLLIAQLRQLHLTQQTALRAIELTKPLLKNLITQNNWLPPWVHDPTKLRQGEAAYVINNPHQDGFMLLLIAWQAGITSCIHDHATWASVGVVQGQETITCYKKAACAEQPHRLEKQKTIILNPGDLCCTTEEAIHQVENTSTDNKLSISLHLYGADLRTITRYTYDLENASRKPNPNSEFISLQTEE